MREQKQLAIALKHDFYTPPERISLKREQRRKQKLLLIIKIIFFLILLALLVGGISLLSEAILNWDYLKIKNIRIINPPRYYQQEVKTIISRYPDNILALDLKALKNELVSIPEISSLELNKILPATLELRFQLEEPFFQREEHPNRFQIISRSGKVINQTSSRQPEFLLLKNVSLENIPTILAVIDEIIVLKPQIEYLTYQKPFGIIFKLYELDELIITGQKEIAPKITLYTRIKKELPAFKEKIVRADLRFNNRFYLEFSGGSNEG